MGRLDETNVPAEPDSTGANTRVPEAVPNSRWPCRARQEAGEGTKPSGTRGVQGVGSCVDGRSVDPPYFHAPAGVPRDTEERSAYFEPLLSGPGSKAERRRGSTHRSHGDPQGGKGGPPQPHQEACPRMVSVRRDRDRPVRRGRHCEAGTALESEGPGRRTRPERGTVEGRTPGRSGVVGAIRLYQRVLSPLLAPACRFYPSCSEYAAQLIEREGVWRGGRRALYRLSRCSPFRRGGLDLP
jgi:putative membrane protein insertion efficiency factor